MEAEVVASSLISSGVEPLSYKQARARVIGVSVFSIFHAWGRTSKLYVWARWLPWTIRARGQMKKMLTAGGDTIVTKWELGNAKLYIPCHSHPECWAGGVACRVGVVVTSATHLLFFLKCSRCSWINVSTHAVCP